MKRIDPKKFLPHVLAIACFYALAGIFFSPVFDGYKLKMSDIQHHRGMSKEVFEHRAKYGEEPLWTNSIFGGMPAYHISTKFGSPVMTFFNQLFGGFLPRPAGFVFVYCLGFYILMMCMRVNPYVGMLGSALFAFSTYLIIIIVAGHTSKADAVAYMAPILGGFLLIFRRNLFWGFLIMAFFMALEIYRNHVQVTYYLFIVLFILGIYELIRASKEKAWKPFLVSSGVVIGAILVGVLVNVSNLYNTYEYSKATIRGKSELTVEANGEAKSNTKGGLDFEYVTRWSYGIDETFTFVNPYAKGESSGPLLYKELVARATAKKPADREAAEKALQRVPEPLLREVQNGLQRGNYISQYYGNQPGTSGPVYLGAAVVYLFFMALIFLKDRVKWFFLAGVVLCTMLSWGHNFPELTKFFLNYFPGYSKFRAVTIILVMVELIVPLLGVLFLHRLLFAPGEVKQEIKLPGVQKAIPQDKFFLLSSGIFLFGMLVLYMVPDSFIGFFSERELNSNMGGDVLAMLKDWRVGVFQEGQLKAIGLVLVAIGSIYAAIKVPKYKYVPVALIGLFSLLDLWFVNRHYLDTDTKAQTSKWEKEKDHQFTYLPSKADLDIVSREYKLNPALSDIYQQDLQAFSARQKEAGKRATLSPKRKTEQKFVTLNQNSDFRVFSFLVDPFNDASLSYFHKATGGYHAAKLMRYQELIEFYIHQERSKIANALNSGSFEQIDAAMKGCQIMNMMNTKYFILNAERPALENQHRFGEAWFVQEVQQVSSPDDEIVSLGKVDLSRTAITQMSESRTNLDATGTIQLKSYRANILEYEAKTNGDAFAVFSEVYYQPGWQAYLDDQPVEHYQTNYTLRGMPVPSGTHKIVFKFEPQSYYATMTLGNVFLWLLLALVVYGLVRTFWLKRA